MALNNAHFWEIALDATQIGMCAIVLWFLIRNSMKFKRSMSNTPPGEKSQHANTDFIVEAVRQQTELAFNHILETIDKERQTLHSYFELRGTRLASGLLKSASTGRVDAISGVNASEPDAADAIYSEIETLADQGLSTADISEKLDVPRGEVDLVLKLKRLSIASAKIEENPQA